MPPNDEETGRGLPQNWSAQGRNAPMLVVQPDPGAEPSTTGGITGMFVLFVLVVSIGIAVWQSLQAWQASQELNAAMQLTKDASGVENYIDDLQEKNEEMTLSPRVIVAEGLEPVLIGEITNLRRAYDEQCQRIARLEGASECALALPPSMRPAPTPLTPAAASATPAQPPR